MQKTFDKKKFLSQNSIWLVLIAMVIIMGVAQPSFFTVNNLLTLLSGEAVKGIHGLRRYVRDPVQGYRPDDRRIRRAWLPASPHRSCSRKAMPTQHSAGSGHPARTAGYPDRSGTRCRHWRNLRRDHRVHQNPALHRNSRRTADLPRRRKNVHQPPGFHPVLEQFRFLGCVPISAACSRSSFVVFFVMFAISAFLLTQTRFGKNVYAIGGNDQAARVAGINV